MTTPTTPVTSEAPPANVRARGFSFLGEGDGSEPRLATPAPGAVGEVLGDRFELQQRVGKGGMGVVYRAYDRQLPKPVAIKILCSKDLAAEQRFVDEIEILGTVSHPHLVVPLGKGRTASGHLYMAMELIAGENLRDRLLEFGPLLWNEALAVGIQVAEALVHLHAAGVLHRDIKPGNIMLLSGTPVVVKLIDLGVAKKQPEQWPAPSTAAPRRFATDTGVAVGTPHYQPLEAGLASPDPRLDVYGLAATIYELCTGRVPERGAYRPMPALPGDPPRDLETVLAVALAADPDARTPTIDALLAELRRVRDQSGPTPLFDKRYVLLRRIGAGGKAEIWLAHHRRARRDVALKLLTRKSGEELVRLGREAQVLSALSTAHHPAFPLLFDAHEEGKDPYLALEFFPSERASKYIDNPLSPAHVIEIGVQLARALIALRELGVLHRDIHTGNVLIDFEAGPVSKPIVKLIDLGMCELLPAWHARVRRFDTPPERQALLGSGGLEKLPWTAPEARQGSGWTDKSDVWSVGLLLFQLLTGRRPFAPGSDEPASPRTWAPTCSSDLAAALLGALHPDPDKRLDAPQLLTRLTDAAAVEGAEDEPKSDESVSPTVSAPPPTMATASSSTPAPMSTASAPASSAAPESSPPLESRPPASHSPSRSPCRASYIAAGLLLTVALVGLVWFMGQASPSQGEVERARPHAVATVEPSATVRKDLPTLPDASPTPPTAPPAPANPAAVPLTERPVLTDIAAPAPPTSRSPSPKSPARKPTFAAVMARLEPQARTCARTAGLAKEQTTVEVRRDAPGEPLKVRVVGLGSGHPFTHCLADIIERAAPPLEGRDMSAFTFTALGGSP